MSLHEQRAMTVDEAIRRRRSVRGFLPDEVPEATLREVFAARATVRPRTATCSPGSPHVVSGEALRRLQRCAGRRRNARSADQRRTFAADPQIPRRASRAAGRRGPAALRRDGRRAARPRRPQDGLYPQSRLLRRAARRLRLHARGISASREATDIGMYAQTLMLALTARGIASCAQGALSLFPDIVREHLGVPEDPEAAVRRIVRLRGSEREGQCRARRTRFAR